MRNPIYVFGYGSLMSNVGLLHRHMRFPARDHQFHECHLSDYERSFSAVYRASWRDHETREVYDYSSRFFGITYRSGAQTNGVVFPIDKRDIDAFVISEGGDRTYAFLNVRHLIRDMPPGVIAPESGIYACVTKAPSFDGTVSQGYIDRCLRALAYRSEAFRAEFGGGDIYSIKGAPPRPKVAPLVA